MAKLRRIHVSGKNRLLAALPRDEYNRLLPSLEKVSLPLRKVLYEANGQIPHIFFPLNGVVSLVITMEGGFTLEVGTIGNEGMVGTPVSWGPRAARPGRFRRFGRALRMETKVFQKEMKLAGPLYGLVQRYTQAMINQISQSTVCNHRHSVEKRMCRWLLMSHDRVGTDEFLLTQEFLGMMLGVRRSSVTEAARGLKNKRIIDYRRGQVTVLDRPGLEKLSCECYDVSKREFDRLLG
jgi:CRP-like cAMP-binding protein